MALPVNASAKFPFEFLHELPLDMSHSPSSDLGSSLSSNMSESLLIPEETDSLPEPVWEALELTAEQVDEVFRSLKKTTEELQPVANIKKRGRWSRCDIMLMSSQVESAQGDIRDRCHQVWGEVAELVGRNRGDCHKRYFKYLEEKELAPQDLIQKKAVRGVFTKEDVIECKRVIKKFNLIRKDGLLDVKRLSEHVNRAYTSLRYNIYQATHSVFCEHPFFVPFRDKYRQIHHLSF